jgi:hypothetical protein
MDEVRLLSQYFPHGNMEKWNCQISTPLNLQCMFRIPNVPRVVVIFNANVKILSVSSEHCTKYRDGRIDRPSQPLHTRRPRDA